MSGPGEHQKPFLTLTGPQRLPPPPPAHDQGPLFRSMMLSLSLHGSRAWHGPVGLDPFPGLSSDLSCRYGPGQQPQDCVSPWLLSPDPIPSQPHGWTALITVNMPAGLASWLKLSVSPEPVRLPLLGCWLVRRSLLWGLCDCTLAPFLREQPASDAPQHSLTFLKPTSILPDTVHKSVAHLVPSRIVCFFLQPI